MEQKRAEGLSFHDFKFKDFVNAIYRQAPQDPFFFRLEFLDALNPQDLQQLLAYFVVSGAKEKYNKQLAELLPNEIEHLREYLLSIGYTVSFKVERHMQKLDKENPDKETPVNYFSIDFSPANPALDPNNKPTHLS